MLSAGLLIVIVSSGKEGVRAGALSCPPTISVPGRGLCSKKVGKTFSEFLRYAAKEYIKMQENLELKEFLLENCDFATLEEENDILEIIKDFDPGDRGRKIRTDELRGILPKKG